MRVVQVLIGIILLIEGTKGCIALPAALSALHVSSAYSAGEATGLVLGAFAMLAGGVLLLVHGWSGRRSSAAKLSAS